MKWYQFFLVIAFIVTAPFASADTAKGLGLLMFVMGIATFLKNK